VAADFMVDFLAKLKMGCLSGERNAAQRSGIQAEAMDSRVRGNDGRHSG